MNYKLSDNSDEEFFCPRSVFFKTSEEEKEFDLYKTTKEYTNTRKAILDDVLFNHEEVQ